MAESTCLHIQESESGPIRVVALPWLWARVGRASYCEVRLSGDTLVDEVCRLQRKGRVWYLMATSTDTPIVLGGREVHGSSLLPFDVPFVAAGHRLTLRPDLSSEPDWEIEKSGPIGAPANVRWAADVSVTTVSDFALEAELNSVLVTGTPKADLAGAAQVNRAEADSRNRPAASEPSATAIDQQPPRQTAKKPLSTRLTACPLVARSSADLRNKALGEALGRAELAGLPSSQRAAVARPVDPRPPSSGVGRQSTDWESRWRAAGARIVARANPELAARQAERKQPPAYVPASPSLVMQSPLEVERKPIPTPAQARTSSLGSMVSKLAAASGNPTTRVDVSGLSNVASPVAKLTLKSWTTARAEPEQAEAGTERRSTPLISSSFDSVHDALASTPRLPSISSANAANDRQPASVANPQVFDPNGSSLEEVTAGRPVSTDCESRENSGWTAKEADSTDFADLRHDKLSEPCTESGTALTAQSPADETELGRSECVVDRHAPPSLELAVGLDADVETVPRSSVLAVPEADPSSEAAIAGGTREQQASTVGEPIPATRSVKPDSSDATEPPPLATRRNVERRPAPGRVEDSERGGERKRISASARDALAMAQVARGTGSARTSTRAKVEWPSAASVMALHQAVTKPSPVAKAAKSGRDQALPTESVEPDQWKLPVWLALPPVVSIVLLTGVAGFLLSCIWATDSYNASYVIHELLYANPSARRQPPPSTIVPPHDSWARTTGQHLAYWAMYKKASGTAGGSSSAEASALLSAAVHVSPLDPMARLAIAQLESSGPHQGVSARSVGLSRDSVSLAWSAGYLASSGKKKEALALYVRALELASREDLTVSGVPQFNEDPQVPRYLLPGEDRFREIIRSLATGESWTVREWTDALPALPVVRLAAARMLRELGRVEADSMIEKVLIDTKNAASNSEGDSLALAARAEAFAIRGGFKESGQEYRQAIEAMPNDRIRRSWWFNLADIAYRLEDETERQSALRFALAVATSDDITRRATDTQRATANRRALGASVPRAN